MGENTKYYHSETELIFLIWVPLISIFLQILHVLFFFLDMNSLVLKGLLHPWVTLHRLGLRYWPNFCSCDFEDVWQILIQSWGHSLLIRAKMMVPSVNPLRVHFQLLNLWTVLSGICTCVYILLQLLPLPDFYLTQSCGVLKEVFPKLCSILPGKFNHIILHHHS